MKLVCGTDFSIHAANAANVAAALAARSHTTLRLVHAQSPSALEFLTKAQVEELAAKLRHKLLAESARLRKTGASVTETLVFGTPHEALIATARQSQADAIVVSTIGQIAPSRWLVGSVAERTAQNSTVPTLVVRDPASLLAWAQGKRPLRVFVGYDFSPSSDAALRLVAGLKNIGPCAITVTYLSWPPTETWRFGIGMDLSADNNNSQEIQRLLERDLKERCGALLGKTKAKLRVVSAWGSQEAHLLDLAKEDQADLIVVGTNQRRGLKRFWLGSVSRGILHHAPTNVACVPMFEAEEESTEHLPSFKRVLIATDFSKPGNKAVAFAYGAAQRGGEVSLLHVISPGAGFRSETKAESERRTKRKQELVRRLEALVPDDARARSIQSQVEVAEHQQPAVAIAQAAERIGADLICLGSSGRSGLKKQLLGSVTEAVLRRSQRPVLVIRD